MAIVWPFSSFFAYLATLSAVMIPIVHSLKMAILWPFSSFFAYSATLSAVMTTIVHKTSGSYDLIYA